MATIKEIADLAGVSRGTVDRVLNKRGSVNPQTAQKIMEIVHALDYKPNRAGLVLAAQKKNLKLGVILFGEGNPFFDEVTDGIRQKEEDLACYNCTVQIKRVNVDTLEQLQAIDEFVKEGINGIAISPTNDPRLARRIDELFEQGIPVVALNTDIKNCKRIAFVGSNYYQSGATAAGLMRLMAKTSPQKSVLLPVPKRFCAIRNGLPALQMQSGLIRILILLQRSQMMMTTLSVMIGQPGF